MERELKIFGGNGNKKLTAQICDYLGLKPGKIDLSRFNDGEVYCQILESVRGKDVFVVQPTCPPVNENLMELLIMIDALKRASSWRITAVIPYYGYSRQERKDKPRVPISAKLTANMLTTSGIDRILTMDLHAPAIQGFFDIPSDHLYAAPVIIEHISNMEPDDLCIVSPDAGGVERARAFAKRLDASLAIIDKRRPKAGVSKIMNVVGDVEDKETLIVDDMIDTAGTVVRATEALIERGAKSVYASGVHPLLSDPAVERIENSDLDRLLITNTIPVEDKELNPDRYKLLSVADLLGEAIKRIHTDKSVSTLFV